ncbi:MAG: hypothetical protein AAFQ37_09615 [Bacteroidota bacterium]
MRKVFLLFTGLLAVVSLLAQDIVTHTDGSKIIVYPDGTARYFSTGELVEDYNGSDGASSYPVIAVKIEPLSTTINITENDLRQIATRRLQLATEAEELAEERARAAADNRQRLEAKLGVAKSDADYTTSSRLQRQVLLARKIEKESAEELIEARLQLNEAKNTLDQNRYVQAYNESRRRRRERSSRGVRNEEALPHARRLLGIAAAGFTGYGKTVTQYARLPDFPCRLAFEGPEASTGQHIRASRPELFFTHTDESLRPYLQGKEYLSANAYVHSRGGYSYLTLNITFANPNAIQTYGYLAEGSLLSIHLLDGNFINLRAVQAANGEWNADLEELKYEVTYVIDRTMISTLRQSELDYVQLFWSSGFEEYDIYQVDVLQRLFNCL